ncbi:MAG: hypothetical protein QUS33_08255 [Dehalococcoidia bacterium]|nr:hypothetical protein [Dehalococcoidia bacterium]
MAEEISKKQMVMAGLGAVTALAVALAKIAPLMVAAKTQFPAAGFFEPEKVKWIADQLPDDSEDEFILAAWDFVARDITYEPVGSDIDFVDGMVYCDSCYSVQQTLNRQMGNCVSKSALLASILLNRLAPDRVWMAVGNFGTGRVAGHAWVQIERGGKVYIIETTAPPPAYPWKEASASPSYQPYAVFCQQEFDCLNHSFCLEASRCNCCTASSQRGRVI